MANETTPNSTPAPDAGSAAPSVPAGDGGAVAAAAPAVPQADSAAQVPAAPVAPVPEKVEAAPEKVEAAKFESTPSLLTAAEGKPATETVKADTPAPDATKEPPKEASKEAQSAPEKDATAITPPAPVTYEAFKVPDGLKLSEDVVKEFTNIIGPKQLPQETAQQLVDFHVKETQRIAEAVAKHQMDVWQNVGETWKNELRNDETLGRNRLDTTLSQAKAVIEQYSGSPENSQKILSLMDTTNLGNNREVVGLLHNIAKALNIFEDKIVAAPPTPPKRTKSPGNRGWYQSMENTAP